MSICMGDWFRQKYGAAVEVTGPKGSDGMWPCRMLGDDRVGQDILHCDLEDAKWWTPIGPEDPSHVEFTITTNPRDLGATHRLVYEDGTVELLTCEGDVRVERL